MRKLIDTLVEQGLLSTTGDAGSQYKYDYNPETQQYTQLSGPGMKKGGKVKKMAAGGYKKAADGCVKRGKTKGRFV